MRTNIYLIIVLSTICFSSCYREKDLKYSLNAAGKNRIELEKYWNIIRIVVLNMMLHVFS